MREEIALVEVDSRGRVQIPLPMRKALSIMPGTIIRIKVSMIEDEQDPLKALVEIPALA